MVVFGFVTCVGTATVRIDSVLTRLSPFPERPRPDAHADRGRGEVHPREGCRHARVAGRLAELAADAGDDSPDRRGGVADVQPVVAPLGAAREVTKRTLEKVPLGALGNGGANELVGVRGDVEELRVEVEAAVPVGQRQRLVQASLELPPDGETRLLCRHAADVDPADGRSLEDPS